MSFFGKIFGWSDAAPAASIPSPPKIAEKRGDLHRIACALMPSLSQIPDVKGRSHALRLFGLKILKEGKSWPRVNWRQFALMHNESLIRDTGWEGGDIRDSILLWRSFMGLWMQGGGCLLPIRLSTQDLKYIDEVLSDLYNFCELMPPQLDKPLNQSILSDRAHLMLQALSTTLKKKKSAYLPLGYRGGITQEGHAIPCKVTSRVSDGQVLIQPLNLGNGAQRHAVLDYTTTQELIALRHFPVQVPTPIFWGEMGHAALCHLLRLHTDPPSPAHAPIQGDDLYDILCTLGTVVADLGTQPRRLEAKLQTAGVCSEKGVRNVVHDILLDLGVPSQDMHFFFLNMTLCSLVSGYHTLVANPTHENSILVVHAAEGLGITVKELKQDLSSEEYTAIVALLTQIKEVAKKLRPPSSQSLLKLRQIPLQPIDSFPNEFPKFSEAKIAATRAVAKNAPSAEKLLNVKGEFTPVWTMIGITQNIDAWIAHLETCSAAQAFPFLHVCALTMPLPVWGEKDVWDTLAETEIPATITRLEQLVKGGCRAIFQYGLENIFIDKVVAIYTVYAVIDKLARRLKHTKLDGFATPFIPDVYGLEFGALPWGSSHDRYARIAHYFAGCSNSAQEKVIFPISPVIPVERFANEALYTTGSGNQGVNHIHFLQRHLFSQYAALSKTEGLSLYLKVWTNMPAYLPQEICTLYFFAYLAECVFFSNRNEAKCPLSLIFSDTLDKGGNKAVEIVRGEHHFLSYHPSIFNRVYTFPHQFKINDNRDFSLLSDRKTKQWTTNDAVCARLSIEEAKLLKISEPTYRDLLRITRRRNLAPSLALQWAASNLILLEHPGIQQTLFDYFFTPSSLNTSLRNEPLNIQNYRELIFEGLTYYRDNTHHFKTILFLIHIGICFETHYAAIYGWQKCQSTLDFYLVKVEKMLAQTQNSEEQQRSLRLQGVFVQALRSSKNEEEIITVLKYLFERSKLWSWGDEYAWLKDQLPELMRIHVQSIKQALAAPGFRNKICSALCSYLISENSRAWEEAQWEGDFPVYTCAGYRVNLATCEMRFEGKGKLVEKTLKNELDNWGELKDKHGSQFWSRNGQMETLDGKFRIVYSKEKEARYEKLILIGSEERWVRIHLFSDTREIDQLNLDFLNYAQRFALVHYVFLERKEGDPDVLTYDYKKDLPEFRIDYTSSGCEITRLDAQGKPLPVKLANLAHLKQDHPLYACAIRFAHPSRLLCFVNEQTSQIEELHFFYMQLRFIRNEHGLQSQEFPGFFLKPDLTLEELNHFPAALILENGLGNLKVIIPSVGCKPASGDFSTDLELTKDYISLSEKSLYLLFDVDPITSDLVSYSRVANFYLALILKMQRSELKALSYLRKGATHCALDTYEWTLIRSFYPLKDRSPAALAFNSQLVYLIVDTIDTMQETRFAEKEFHAEKDFYTWSLSTYMDYLKLLQSETLSPISKDLRLTLEQERSILRYLKRKYTKPEDHFPQLLTLRYQLLCANKEKVTASIAAQDVELRPSLFQNVESPSTCTRSLSFFNELGRFPYGPHRKILVWEDATWIAFANRMSKATLEVHFPPFYEQARRCKQGISHPFDFTLLACLSLKKQDGISLASALFYVRHFPHLFAHLSLENASEKSQANTFSQILHIIENLEKKAEFIHWKKQFQEAKTTFSYTNKTELRMPVAPPRGRSLCPPPAEPYAGTFQDLCHTLFEKVSLKPPIPAEPPFLDSKANLLPRSLEADVIGGLASGYNGLCQRSSTHYRLIPEQLKQTAEILRQRKVSFHGRLVELRKNVVRSLNAPYRVYPVGLQQEAEFRLAQLTGQNLTLFPETVMKESILKGDPTFLELHCPLLPKEEIKNIQGLVCEYYRLLTLYQVSVEALVLVQKLHANPLDLVAQSDLAALLDYPFMDCRAYPEIYYFKVTAGKLPRPEQMAIYVWVCEGLNKGENRLFQHKPGGGKTDYLTPLLMLRARKEGLMPVFFSTPMMYAVDKENLGFTLSKVEQHLYCLEVGLHMKLSAASVQFILEQLTHYHAEGEGLIMTPQTYYSLRLQYYYAGIEEKDAAKVQALSLILDFFETRCLQIGDEAHYTYDPTTRAIYGVGDYFFLPEHERTLFLHLLKPLLGFEKVITPSGISLCTLAGMAENRNAFPSNQAVGEVQLAIATHMSTSPLLSIPQDKRMEMITYWTSTKAPQPEFLKKIACIDKHKADLIVITGYFILEVVPQLLRMRTELDHAPSIFQEEEFDTPCHHKTPSTAQYEDPYLTCSTSIKGTAHRALSEMQIRSLITHLLKKDYKEQVGESEAAALFKSWLEKTPCCGFHLRDISLSSPTQMKELTLALSKHPAAVEYYLMHFILPQVGYCLKQLQATPAHLLNGFKRACLFTATPISQWIYPRSVKALRLDSVYEAEVAAEWCKEKNQQQMIVNSADTFFKEAAEKYPGLFKEGRVMIDPSGFFCDMRNEDAARDWLLATKMDGVFYFKEGNSLHVNKDEKVMLLMRGVEKPIEIGGTNAIESVLKKHYPKDGEELNIGTYFDVAHTESANILQKVGTTALLFVGDKLTLSRLIQALLRLRGWLDEKMVQKVIWVYPSAAAKKIAPTSPTQIRGPALFSWCAHHEAEAMKKQIILAAFQEIAYHIENLANAELKAHLHTPQEQIAVMQKYASGFLESNLHDPYRDFANHPTDIDAAQVLLAYAASRYAAFGYRIPFERLDKKGAIMSTLEQVTRDVKRRIAQIPSSWGQNLALSVELHTRVKQDTEQVDYRPRPFDPISAEPIYGDCGIDHPDFPYGRVSAQTAYGSKGLTNNLFIEENQLRTAANAGQSMKSSYLKPIDFFIIVLTKEGVRAIVVANEICSTFLKTLLQGSDRHDVKHQVFVVTASGKLEQRGKRALAPDEQEMQRILKSPWMQDLVIDAALLKGQIVHPDRLLERMKSWPDFESFWKRTVEAQPNPETANRRAMDKLIASTKS